MVAVILSCTVNNTPAGSEPNPEPAAAAKPATAGGDQEWGTVKGHVVFAGDDIPKPVTIDTSKEPKCKTKDGGPITSEEWVVNPKNKGVQWAIVWLVPEGSEKLRIHPDLAKPAKKEVEIDQPCCMFQPHSVALQKGQVLVAKNSSQIAHNVDWKGIRQTGGNTLVPPGGKLVIDQIKVSDFPITINCGIHPWMKANARMFDHPYFAVTDADGGFEIKNAPAGKCRIVVWHEAVGYSTGSGKKGEPIDIKAGGTTDLGTLELKPKKD
jgi:hypothetical protein